MSPEQEKIKMKKDKNPIHEEYEIADDEKKVDDDKIKLTKNKKMKMEEDEDEENFDEETRAEADNTMKPVLELKDLLKENEKIKYDFVL